MTKMSLPTIQTKTGVLENIRVDVHPVCGMRKRTAWGYCSLTCRKVVRQNNGDKI